MSKILFINASPNKSGNTFKIGNEILKDKEYDTLQMSDYKVSQYGNIYNDDEIIKIFDKIKDYDTLLIGSPVYWYSVSGLLKTFIDRFYMLDDAKVLNGKNLYFFAQGSAPSKETIDTIKYLITRMSKLMEINLKCLEISSVSDETIINKIQNVL